MKKILVIDDDQAFLELVKTSVDTSRYEVAAIADGVEALESLKKGMPDLILLDLSMPRMGGMEFLEHLKHDYADAHVPVFITSNDSSLDMISKGAELGVRGYIVKSNESMKTIMTSIDNVFAETNK